MAAIEGGGQPGELATSHDVQALAELRADIHARLERFCREHNKPGVYVLEWMLAYTWGWYRKTKRLDLRLAPSALGAITEELMNRAGLNWRACEEAERRRQLTNVQPLDGHQTG